MTPQEKNTYQNHNLNHHSDDADAFLERMRALFAHQETVMERIDFLLRQGTEGKDELDMLLDKLTDTSLAEDTEYNDNIQRMRSGRLSDSEKKSVRNRQREIFYGQRLLIAREAGVPDEVAQDELTQARQRIGEILKDQKLVDGRPQTVLEQLGIITLNEDGKEVFTYPRHIMPDSTNQKWDIYISAVVEYLRLQDAVKHERADRVEFGEADKARRYAHDSLARDVDEVLGLDQLEGSAWDFEQTRNLLAKMRDSKFPTVETAEKERVEDHITIALHAVHALATRVADFKKDQ